MGVGIEGGLEAAVHSLSSFINAYGENPTLCRLKLDMSNAFNNCHRTLFCIAYIENCQSYLAGLNGVITQRQSFVLVIIDLLLQLVFNKETL